LIIHLSIKNGYFSSIRRQAQTGSEAIFQSLLGKLGSNEPDKNRRPASGQLSKEKLIDPIKTFCYISACLTSLLVRIQISHVQLKILPTEQ
jgi:hypothetical protein